MRTLITYEHLPWEMTSLLGGCGPLRLLLSDESEIVIKPGLGPGYWDRAYKLLANNGIEDVDGVFPASMRHISAESDD